MVPGDREAVTGYEAFFGLVESPFSVTPNPRFLFESRSYSTAFEQVMLAIRRREALVVVTGEIGTGKTLLCRTIVEQLPARTFLSVITNSFLGSDDLLIQILQDFGILSNEPSSSAGASRHDLVRTLQQFLTSLVSLKGHAVIVIDEAQHLGPDVLEQLRLLSNFETDESKLLQIILVGQPDLEMLLAKPEMRQLVQRVSRRCTLQPLETGEVQQYIERRLWVAHGGPNAYLNGRVDSKNDAGLTDNPKIEQFLRVRFTGPAMRAVADLSAGLPRVVNVICDRALEQACAEEKRVVDPGLVLAAAHQMKIPVSVWQRWKRSRYPALAAALLLVIGAGWGVSRSLGIGVMRQAVAPVAATTSRPEPVVVAPPPAAGALPEADSLTLLVASFRTSSKASAVADQAAAMGLPAFTATSGEWSQVLIGPYVSRDEIREAQAKLQGAGLRETRILINSVAAQAARGDEDVR